MASSNLAGPGANPGEPAFTNVAGRLGYLGDRPSGRAVQIHDPAALHDRDIDPPLRAGEVAVIDS